VVDNPPTGPVDSDNATNQVTEGAAAGTAVGVTASSTDPDAGDTVAYSLTANPSGFFQIDANTGVVSVSSAGATGIDYESTGPGHTYTITVAATDNHSVATTSNFTIAVLDAAPSAPTDSDPTANSVAEGAAAGTAVGITAASSIDPNGGTVTYSLTADSSNGGFTIDPSSGVVTVADSTKVDYESTAPGHTYTVTVTASDGTLASTQNFSVAVTDVAPTASGLSATTTAAVQGGSAVTLLTAPPTVGDVNSTTLAGATVTISAGLQSGDILSANTTGTAITASYVNGVLTLIGNDTFADYQNVLETVGYQDTGSDATTIGHPSRSFSWTVTDGTLSSTPATTTLTIDRVPAQAPHNVGILEGASVGPASAGDSDPDGDSLTITGVSGGTVGNPLSGTYGALTLNSNDTYSYTANNTAAINAASSGSHPTDTFSYTASDGQGGSAAEILTFTVDRPPTMTAHSVTVTEGASIGTTSAGDSDPDGDGVTVTAVTGGTVGSPLAGTYGTLTLNANDTYSYTANNTAAINAASSTPTDTFTYTVSDSEGGNTTETLAFTISRLPVVTAANVAASAGQSFAASALFNATSPGGTTITSYQVEDENADPGSGFWVLNGMVEPAGQVITMPASELSELSFAAGAVTTGPITDILEVRAANGSGYGAFSTFTVTAAQASANPTISVSGPNPAPPAGTTADMIIRQPANGTYDIVDVGNNSLLAQYQLGQILPQWQVAGVGGFDGSDTADLILRDPSSGEFEVFDISNNMMSTGIQLGPVGLEWSVDGFGDFSGRPGETDMLMQSKSSGANSFAFFDIQNNTVTSVKINGLIGAEWQEEGFGDFSGQPNETDMLLRRSTDGMFAVFDIQNDAFTSFNDLGPVGLEWSVAGVGDFSGRPNEADVLLQSSVGNATEFAILDVQNNEVTSTAITGLVGNEWQVAGFGDFSGQPNETDMVMRRSTDGALALFDISNNVVQSGPIFTQVGSQWQVAGVGANSMAASTAQMVQAMAAFAPSSSASQTAPITQLDNTALTQLSQLTAHPV
jgi:VCBS repeat-containing protein